MKTITLKEQIKQASLNVREANTKIIHELDHIVNDEWSYWSDNEIDNFGKIAIGLSNHNYDDEDEDYSK